MQEVIAFFELFPSRVPYVLLLVAIILALIGLIPFRFAREGLHIQSPTKMSTKAILVIFGLLIFYGSIEWIITTDEIALAKLSKKHLTSLFAYVVIGGSEDECKANRCRISFHQSILLTSPKGQVARYEDRVKAGGRIISFNTIPMPVILNPEQYPANPTLVEYRINPASDDDRLLQAQGEAIIETAITANNGKVGPHIPYDTDSVTFILDLRTLKFKLSNILEPKIETKRSDGVLASGYRSPAMSVFENGQVIVLTAANVPADSSVYLKWGNYSQIGNRTPTQKGAGHFTLVGE